jgi:hypothetical protein
MPKKRSDADGEMWIARNREQAASIALRQLYQCDTSPSDRLERFRVIGQQLDKHVNDLCEDMLAETVERSHPNARRQAGND